jgi:hypothetical protein
VRRRTAEVRCWLTEGDEKAAQPTTGEGERINEIRRAEVGEASDATAQPSSALFYFVGEERKGLIWKNIREGRHLFIK